MTLSSDKRWLGLWVRTEMLDYAALTEDERTYLNVQSLIDSVENGGLISYFYNSGADTLDDCRKALRKLSALDVLARVDRLAELFVTVPSTVEERNRVIDSWPDDETRDALLARLDAELMPLVRSLDEQLESFVTSQGLVDAG